LFQVAGVGEETGCITLFEPTFTTRLRESARFAFLAMLGNAPFAREEEVARCYPLMTLSVHRHLMADWVDSNTDAHQIWKAQHDPVLGLARHLRDKAVFVGFLNNSDEDKVLSPTNGVLPGVFRHAIAFENLAREGLNYVSLPRPNLCAAYPSESGDRSRFDSAANWVCGLVSRLRCETCVAPSASDEMTEAERCRVQSDAGEDACSRHPLTIGEDTLWDIAMMWTLSFAALILRDEHWTASRNLLRRTRLMNRKAVSLSGWLLGAALYVRMFFWRRLWTLAAIFLFAILANVALSLTYGWAMSNWIGVAFLSLSSLIGMNYFRRVIRWIRRGRRHAAARSKPEPSSDAPPDPPTDPQPAPTPTPNPAPVQ
ncbi:MAG: hypothetical protein AAF360_15660, partial [Pseudomonadota bacterium]